MKTKSIASKKANTTVSDIDKEWADTFKLTPLAVTKLRELKHSVEQSHTIIEHIEFSHCDGVLKCDGFSLNNVTPAEVDRFIEEISYIVSSFNHPEYAEME